MYIISKHVDYYDCIMKQGIDKSLIYYRHETHQDSLSPYSAIYRYYQKFKEESVNESVRLPAIKKNTYSSLSISTGLLGFCGRQYPVVLCQYLDTLYVTSCIYHHWLDKLKQSKLSNHEANVYKLIQDYLKQEHKEYIWQRHAYSRFDSKEKLILATIEKQSGLKISDELFIELETPIFFIYQNYQSKTILIKNPILKTLDFQSIFNPELCFQEIAMYIGNFLNQKDNPQQITDSKILCVAKGFDVKTSFRKPPSV